MVDFRRTARVLWLLLLLPAPATAWASTRETLGQETALRPAADAGVVPILQPDPTGASMNTPSQDRDIRIGGNPRVAALLSALLAGVLPAGCASPQGGPAPHVVTLQAPSQPDGNEVDRLAPSAPECTEHADCDDDLFCTGAEQCLDGVCVTNGPPCGLAQICVEQTDSCRPAHHISGLVTTFDEIPVPQVHLTFVGERDSAGIDFTVTSGADGRYSVSIPEGWTGRAKPGPDHHIKPNWRSYVGVSGSLPQDDYVAFKNLYVDDDGEQQPGYNPASPLGATDRPCPDIQTAVAMARPGDTIYIRGGLYQTQDEDQWTRIVNFEGISGAPGLPIRLQAYESEQVTLLSCPTNRYGIWIKPDANFIQIAGLTICGAQRAGVYCEGNDCLVEDCVFQACGASNETQAGSSGVWVIYGDRAVVRRCLAELNYSGIVLEASDDSLVQDCIARDNGQPYPENGDGFRVKSCNGGTLRRCIAYRNADDGIDASNSSNILIEYCVAYEGNHLALPDGDGQGFKVGNYSENLVVRYCLAFNNLSSGIDARSSTTPLFYNNTAYGNGGNGISTGAPGTCGTFLANVSFQNEHDLYDAGTPALSDYNCWGDGNQVPGQDSHSISGDPRFADPDDPGVELDLNAPRFADAPGFHLQPGSPCIDAGFDLDLNLPAYDDAETSNSGGGWGPIDFFDMGAYEFGLFHPQTYGAWHRPLEPATLMPQPTG